MGGKKKMMELGENDKVTCDYLPAYFKYNN